MALNPTLFFEVKLLLDSTANIFLFEVTTSGTKTAFFIFFFPRKIKDTILSLFHKKISFLSLLVRVVVKNKKNNLKKSQNKICC